MTDTQQESGRTSADADPGRRGRLHLASRAVDRIAGHAAGQVPGVSRRGTNLGRLVGRTSPTADSTVAGDTVRVQMDVAVLWPHGAGDVARQVRSRVGDELGRLTGLSVAAVDVTVSRFDQPEETSPGRVQ